MLSSARAFERNDFSDSRDMGVIGSLFSLSSGSLQRLWLMLSAFDRARYWRLICGLFGVIEAIKTLRWMGF